ncbi:MAG: SAM-dependent methyltransferase [Chloroflexi bacterium]|nr:SAM-dependent methyltransferase [Chloroflexota bacterium]
MDWSDDGLLGKLPGAQLERSLYVKVNKALESMGGKWNRKSGGHVFGKDPRSEVEGLIESGTIELERDGFFETPRAVVDRMLELVPLPVGAFVLEPSAGMGAIAKVLRECGGSVNIWCVEKNDDRALKLRDWFGDVFCCDFLTWEPKERFTHVYMNPPFENLQDVDHVMHAYDLLEDGGTLVSVMAESAFFRNDNKASLFRSWAFSNDIYTEQLPEGSFKESGTGVNTRLIVAYK